MSDSAPVRTAGPRTDETVARRCDELRGIGALLRDVPVEVLDGLAEPHAKNEERGNPCDPCQQRVWPVHICRRTNQESEESEPSGRTLQTGPVEHVAKLAHLPPEGGHGEQDEEDDGEGERDRDEGGGRRRRCGQQVRSIARKDGEV